MGGLSRSLVGKLVSVFWWVELDFFSLECSEVSTSEFGDVYRFGVTLATCIWKVRAMLLHCWIICMVCRALKLISSWVMLGFSAGMEAFG